MHLLVALAAGVRGAEDGTAELYRRGTATRATWYTDFKGAQAQSSGADIELDENGAVVAYVNELVDVLVKDADGTTVREFVAGAAAPAVEYQGQSFTGTDYTTGAQAAGKPTTAQAIFDLWKTNSGAIDWKVLVNGAATTLANAISGVTGLFFNVKDPTYGAVGDGVTNDTTAVAAAMSAANSAGGIVFFPPGTYRITSALTLGAKTSLMGCGSSASALLIDHASNNLLAAAGGTTHPFTFITGLRLGANQSNSGHMLTMASGTYLAVRGCEIGDSNCTGDILTAATSTTTTFAFEDCYFSIGSTSGIFNGAGALRRGRFERCLFAMAAGAFSPANGLIYGRQLDLVTCKFTNEATSGTYSCFKSNSTTVDAKITGCVFDSSGGATVTAIELGTYASGAVFFEAHNTFGASGVTAYSYTCGAASLGAQVHLNTRETRKYTVTDNNATVSLPVSQYGMINLIRTSNAAQAISMDKSSPEGARLTLTVTNNSGSTINSGTWTFTAGSGDNVFIPGAIPTTFLNNTTYVSEMRGRVSQGTMTVSTVTGGGAFNL